MDQLRVEGRRRTLPARSNLKTGIQKEWVRRQAFPSQFVERRLSFAESGIANEAFWFGQDLANEQVGERARMIFVCRFCVDASALFQMIACGCARIGWLQEVGVGLTVICNLR